MVLLCCMCIDLGFVDFWEMKKSLILIKCVEVEWGFWCGGDCSGERRRMVVVVVVECGGRKEEGRGRGHVEGWDWWC